MARNTVHEQRANDDAGQRWRVGRPVRSLLIGYLVVVLMLTFLEKSLLFPAMRYPAGDLTAAARLGLEDVWFESDDGTRLHGWLAVHENPRGGLLFCHGNAGNVTHRAEPIETLRRRLGMTVFVFDYRGYGRSDGAPTETGLLADARAARDWLAGRMGLDSEELVIMGRSMGGGVATRLAAEGRQDEIVPFSHGERLFEAATTATKRFLPVSGGHNDWPGDDYYDALAEVVESSLERDE